MTVFLGMNMLLWIYPRSHPGFPFCTAAPYFDYCCSSWYTGIGAKYKARLDALQRRMAMFVFKMEPRDHVGREQLLRLKWFSVQSQVYFKLIHVFRVSSNRPPRYIASRPLLVYLIFTIMLLVKVNLTFTWKNLIASVRCLKALFHLPSRNGTFYQTEENSFKSALKTYLLNH